MTRAPMSDFTDLVLGWMESGDAPAAVVTKKAGQAAATGQAAAEGFADSFADSLTKLVTAATIASGDWPAMRTAILGNMETAFDSFGVGLSEAEKLTRLEATYNQTMADEFSSSLFKEMFGGTSMDAYPFVQFWSQYDSDVCSDCQPIDGGIFDKTDPHLPYILPPLHFGPCRCWAEEITRMEAAAQPQMLEPSAYKYFGNVSPDFLYSKTIDDSEGN